MALTDLLNQLPPNTRKYALAAAGLAAVALVVRGRSSSEADAEAEAEADTADDGTTATGSLPYTYDASVLGVDQLSEFESSIATQLAELTETVAGWDKPQGTTGTPTASTTRGLKSDTIRNGESANTAAIRLRKAGNKAYNGDPLTGAYIVSINRRYKNQGWEGGTATSRRWTGQRFVY